MSQTGTPSPDAFTNEQKTYLQGFVAGTDAARTMQGLRPVFGHMATATAGATGVSGAGGPAPGLSGPLVIHQTAQDHVIAAGGQLVAEEKAKREKNPFEMWDEMRENAAADRFPKGSDIFLYKYHGLFYVAPAQDSFMCRLRIPGGVLNAHQMRGLAGLCETLADGQSDITTRANLQIRNIAPGNAVELLQGLCDLGLTSRGSGADNVRNITGSPTAGLDPQELIDTQPLVRDLHHTILNHRELYGLPRKFNVAFDGGGSIPVLEETNDVGFQAVQVSEGRAVPPGVYFRLLLGGISGHHGLAFDSGVIVPPADCTAVTVAILRVFIDHGVRTDRRKARLKYLLDNWSEDRFLSEVEQMLGRPLLRLPRAACLPRPVRARDRHIGVYPQRQAGYSYIGVTVPVGRLSVAQMHGLAAVADRYGSGSLRLTVWQNLLLTDIPDIALEAAQDEIVALGLSCRAQGVGLGLVACTGNRGCKFAAADTKGHAVAIARHVETRMDVDSPVNVHLTGCHNSCAQHLIGDIGLIGTRLEEGDDLIEAYTIHVGGGFGDGPALAHEVLRDVPASTAPKVVESMLRVWQNHRREGESFTAFVRRQNPKALPELFAVAA